MLELEGEGLRILCYGMMALGVYHFDLILWGPNCSHILTFLLKTQKMAGSNPFIFYLFIETFIWIDELLNGVENRCCPW